MAPTNRCWRTPAALVSNDFVCRSASPGGLANPAIHFGARGEARLQSRQQVDSRTRPSRSRGLDELDALLAVHLGLVEGLARYQDALDRLWICTHGRLDRGTTYGSNLHGNLPGSKSYPSGERCEARRLEQIRTGGRRPGQ